MKILISNDDGVRAPGLHILADVLSAEHQLSVVAPDRDKSGASNSLTLDNPLRAVRLENGYYQVNGTPTDCVHIALTGLMDSEPDIVVSGINCGSNMGDDVLYSGTVAAATEGRHLGLPAIAVSIASFTPKHWDTAAAVILKLLRNMGDHLSDQAMIWNVNIPDLPMHEIKGLQITRLGNRHKAEAACKAQDARGDTIWWVGPPGAEQDAGEGTDFYAVRNGYISITPLHIDLTCHAQIPAMTEWLGTLDAD